jgi:hypothetical protein
MLTPFCGNPSISSFAYVAGPPASGGYNGDASTNFILLV